MTNTSAGASLNALFGFRPRRRPQTRLWAVWPDGRSNIIEFREGHWWWRQNAGSFPQSSAVWSVEQEGGKVVRLPVGQRPGNEQ